jgi:hypothetical protein
LRARNNVNKKQIAQQVRSVLSFAHFRIAFFSHALPYVAAARRRRLHFDLPPAPKGVPLLPAARHLGDAPSFKNRRIIWGSRFGKMQIAKRGEIAG